jgi:hypothetical protein
MPDKINLDSSGLRRSACSAVLSRREKVYSHSTTVLKSVKQSWTHAYLVLFSFFYAIGTELKCGVHPHWVLAKSSSQRVRGIESTQPCGLRHNKKSERAECIASTQQDSIFQLIVGSKQLYQMKPQQDLVDSSLSKTIIFETSNAFSRRLIVTFIKPNANFPLSKSSLQSVPNSLLERNDKFIVVSKLRAPNESVSNKDFQLVVDSKLILNSEGARAVTITSYSVYEGA